MAITRKEEQRLVSHEEAVLLAPSHHPELGQLSPEDLRALAERLRAQQHRARDLVREATRARRGKGEARGAATSAERFSEKKQVFAAALRRVNAQFQRAEDARRSKRAAKGLRQALQRRRAAQPHHPQPGRHAGQGMRDSQAHRDG